MFDLQALQDWLTKSVGGILVLGAAGSILGAILISIVKSLTNRLLNSKDKVMLWFLNQYNKEILIGEAVEKTFGASGKDGQFIVYHIARSIDAFGDFIAFMLSLTLVGHVAIAYGIARPFLLSGLIAVSLLLFHYTLKSMLRISGHCPNEIADTERFLSKTKIDLRIEDIKKTNDQESKKT